MGIIKELHLIQLLSQWTGLHSVFSPKGQSVKIYTTLLVSMVYMVNLYCQPFKLPPKISEKEVRIYDAEKLISDASVKGLKKLEETVYPIKLTYLDPSFSSVLIDLEFKEGFLKKHHSNKDICDYILPKYTIELAKKNNTKALVKLYEYYIKLPKFIKSDTIYSIYNDLDDFLKILVKSYNPKLQKRLSQDYKEWMALSKVSTPKSYPTIEESRNRSYKKSIKLKEVDLYVDCSYMALQLAGALNYLKVKEFDKELLENLKQQQTYPYANGYSFQVSNFRSTPLNTKVVSNTESIKDFKDPQKLESFLFKNTDYCCESKIIEIIYTKSKAYIRNNGSDGYLLILNPNNTITIESISMIMSHPFY